MTLKTVVMMLKIQLRSAINQNSSPNTNDLFIWIQYFIHFKTVATEVEIQFLSTLMSLLAQFGSAFFSSKEGVPILLSI